MTRPRRSWLARMTDRITSDQEKAPDPPPASNSDAYVERLRAGLDEIRSHLRRTGAALGAAATAVLGGLGYAQLHQLFPLPADLGSLSVRGVDVSGRVLLLLGAVAAALAAAGGAAWVAARFFKAQRRILLSSDGASRGLDTPERRLVENIFGDYAEAAEAESLRALELRGNRLSRIARRLPTTDPRGAGYKEEAACIVEVVETAIVESAAEILERRAENVFSGRWTGVPLALTIAGIVGLFGAADFSKGHRDLVDLRAKCAEATKNGASDACDPVRSSEQRDAIARALAAKSKAARAAAIKEAKKQAPHAVALYQKVFACSDLLETDPGLAAASEGVKSAAVRACAGVG